MTRTSDKEPIELVLSRLPDAKETTRGWRTKCPVHQTDRSKNLSLSLWENADGSVWFKCYAGCDNESVVHALGLSFSDCFPGSSYRESKRYDTRLTKQRYIAKEQIRPGVTLLMIYAGVLSDHWEQVAPLLDLDERDRRIFLGVSAGLREVLND